MDTQLFKDKVVLITGSSQGIGRATAVECIRHGATVVINGRNLERLLSTERELRQAGAKIHVIQGDVSSASESFLIIEKTIQMLGKLDILINNAGISMRGIFAKLDPDVFRTVFETNVIGVTNITIPAIQYIRESRGSIVFISSVAGIRGLPGLSAYCASKMALRAIAESIRIEEAKSGIHVGFIQVGQTEIEPGKKTIAADGSLVIINDRSQLKVASMDSVASAVVNNLKHRKFVTTLSGLGKLNAIMQSIAPGLVEKILIRQTAQIARRS
jgi:short-subunit dehydrogenase